MLSTSVRFQTRPLLLSLILALYGVVSTIPAADIPPFVFTKHFDLGGSHYAYTEAVRNARSEYHFHGGSALCRWRPDGAKGVVDTLVTSPEGVIRDPDVSYDGERILFAWKKSSQGDDYHLYEMDRASGDIRQLTFGEDLADYEAAYLANGDIVFNSTRCVQRVDCFSTPVSNLFLCDKDGRYMRRIGYDQVHTNYPTVLDDGRVIYTRWDYNDRGQVYPQPLFVMNPDGTEQTEMYGNNSFFPTSILHARGISGTGKIVGILSGHHTMQQGKPAIINPRKAKNCPLNTPVVDCGIEYLVDVAPEYETAFRKDHLGQDGDVYQYPYPLSENEFIVGARLGTAEHFSLYYLKTDEKPRLLVSDPAISCNQPVPLTPRPRPPVIASRVDYTRKTGTFSMQDIYFGEAIKGIERGTIKKLRVIALEYRAETNDKMAGDGKYSANGITGPGGRGDVYMPVSLGLGSWDVKRVLGDATVYDDGSAYFEVPARTPVYFQALDEKGHAVQTMRSWSTLMPGEHFGCVGCHENKLETPPPMSGTSMAVANGVEKLEEFYGPPRGFSFPHEIQPILDKRCVSCHNASHAKLDLTDRMFNDHGRDWSVSYRNLTHRDSSYISIIGAQSIPEMLPPYFAGASQSMLVEHLETGHTQIPTSAGELVLSDEEMDKIACWIDLLAPFAGDYRENVIPELLERYNKGLAKREAWEQQEAENVAAYIEASGKGSVEQNSASLAASQPAVKSVRINGDGNLYIDFTGAPPAYRRISLFDMSGREVFTDVHAGTKGSHSCRFTAERTAQRARGIYILKVDGGNVTSNHIINTGHVSRRP